MASVALTADEKAFFRDSDDTQNMAKGTYLGDQLARDTVMDAGDKFATVNEITKMATPCNAIKQAASPSV